MWHFRSIVLLALFGSLLAEKAALAQQPLPPGKPAPPPAPATPPAPPPPPADPAATRSLEQALELLNPTKYPCWLETTLWQQVDLLGATFQAEGRYLAGPQERLRVELKVRLGGTVGEMTLVSDGTTVWQTMRAGSGERVVSKWELKKILEALKTPGMAAQVRDEFLRGQLFMGVMPLLENLQKQMVFTQQTPAQWNGQEVFKLTGVWSAEVTKTITPQPENWPAYLPRTCHVYLDSKTLWPYRLEWWGPAPPSSTDALLLQMEFRTPVRHKAEEPMPKSFAGAFQFDAGTAAVTDVTKELTEQLRARNQQLATPRRTAPAPGPAK